MYVCHVNTGVCTIQSSPCLWYRSCVVGLICHSHFQSWLNMLPSQSNSGMVSLLLSICRYRSWIALRQCFHAATCGQGWCGHCNVEHDQWGPSCIACGSIVVPLVSVISERYVICRWSLTLLIALWLAFGSSHCMSSIIFQLCTQHGEGIQGYWSQIVVLVLCRNCRSVVIHPAGHHRISSILSSMCLALLAIIWYALIRAL